MISTNTNNYLKVVGDNSCRIYSTYFFDDECEESLRDALTKGKLAVRSPAEPSHLVMWRKPRNDRGLLDKMRYSTPCPDGEHRFTDSKVCGACGRALASSH